MALKHGRCECGAVTFTCDITADSIGACHCSTCRRINSGPNVCVEAHGLTVADGSALGVYNSSDWADRTFCTKCGSSIAYRLKGTDMSYVAAYLFEPPLDLPLTGEVFIDQKPADYSFAGDTQKMTGPELFAMMQGGQG